MGKIFKYGAAYIMWIADLAIALWFLLLARNDLTSFLALFYKEGNLTYGHMVEFIDKLFTIILGLGWLALMIIGEEYYRRGVQVGDLFKRIARITGPLVLAVFIADLILFALQGFGSGTLMRWLILAVELGIAAGLIYQGNPKLVSKTH
jgi:hypothetical protein